MSLKSISSPLHLPPPAFPSLHNPTFLPRNLQIRKRRRLKVLNVSGPLISVSFETLFHSLVSVFPSVNSLDLIAPALGFASGAALYFSTSAHRGRPRQQQEKKGTRRHGGGKDPEVVGDWILFTSPTPFNRCVLLRCPSVSFDEGGELLEGVNERLVREERHYVNLSRGRIPADLGASGAGDEVSYQRVCVGTDDGGVISLDWPENLDLGKEQGLDTTVLLVPGTTEGSMDVNVRAFVYEALKHGCFPIVMNPRGCAGSPLTTPRLFTAADSDDICTAIQFINKSRPWTTLLSIGWGYGANMLTKYLGEVGERTPLTAAVCIDNPFDLDEATKSFPHRIAVDKKLTGGMIDILRANKEIFQGKTKGFNVAKALSASSMRDFEGAVSMISYGFEAIEDFYSKSSTRQLVSSVKIPLLFIQSDDGTVPLFSIPRSSIAENPFTSLLLCSCLPSKIIRSERSAIIWCQNLAIEWLSAVELALLKGRHPLLKDVDITVTPPKGLQVGGSVSEKSISAGDKTYSGYDSADLYLSRKNENREHFLKLPNSNAASEFLMDPIRMMLEQSESAGQEKASDYETVGTKQLNDTDKLQESSSVDVGLGKEGGDSSIDSENSQVVDTASVVLNTLDVTMPGTLDDEQKKKVLTAMEQGETLMKALQGAVPEDVRGKLAAAVSEMLQTQGTNLNLDRLKKIGWIPNVTLKMKSKIQEKIKGISTAEGGPNGTHSSDHGKSVAGNEARMQDDTVSFHPGDDSVQQNNGSSQEKSPQASGHVETDSEVEGKLSQPSKAEKVCGVLEAVDDQDKVNQNHRVADRHEDGHLSVKEANAILHSDVKRVDSTTEEKPPISSSNPEESHASGSSSLEHKPFQKEGNDIQKNEDINTLDKADQNVQNSSAKSEDPPSHHSSSNPPSISVSQALDALTGFDDSTQMAVNSVFGVIENMIDQLEKETDKTDGEEIKDEVQESGNTSKKSSISNYSKSGKNEDGKNALRLESDVKQSSGKPETRIPGEYANPQQDVVVNRGDKKLSYNHSLSDNSAFARFPGNITSVNYLHKKNSDKVGSVQKLPLEFSVNPYWESPYTAYLRYFSSQISNMKSLDSQSTTDLFLDPEEGRWKMLDQTENSGGSINNIEEHPNINSGQIIQSPLHENAVEEIIEPSYAILDTEQSKLEHQSIHETLDNADKQDDLVNARKEELMCLVKNTILDALKVEVGRRLGVPNMKEIESNIMYDLEQVADAVSYAVIHDSELILSLGSKDAASVKFGTIPGQQVIKTISCAVHDTSHLGKVLPVGVIVGSTLASLRKYFHVAALHDDDQSEAALDRSVNMQDKHNDQESDIRIGYHSVDEKDQFLNLDSSCQRGTKVLETIDPSNGNVMVGAVTAALGASALLAHQVNKQINLEAQKKKVHKSDETVEIPFGSIKAGGDSVKVHDNLEEAMQEKSQNNLVSSFAEKAMSVAGPVIPTKNGGEVDHERLVAVLSELGQKGGILRLIGKVALLWGGIRGAMSLTDRLISFLRIAERPLFQRILGFVSMVLVIWSPVVIPLLPTLVQSWTTKSSTGIAEYACIIGLYVAIMMLVMLWGKRIRGYENPIKQYGLDLTSASKVHDFCKGFLGGTMLVLCIHMINAVLGYACLVRPSVLPSSSAGAVVLFKTYGSMLILSVRGILTAIGIAIVEELLFRSWLPEEIAVDHGYHQAIIISGLAFSLLQRSLSSIPGFLFLSLALLGAKQRGNGSLSLPIGIRTGIMTANFVLQTGGFLTYRPGTPFWLASAHPWHPFDGVVGLAICIILAVLLHPRQSLHSKRTPMAIRE